MAKPTRPGPAANRGVEPRKELRRTTEIEKGSSEPEDTSTSAPAATSPTQLSTTGSERTERRHKTGGRLSRIDALILRPGQDGKQEAVKVSDAILETIRIGNYKETAANYAGISTATLYRWIEQGDPDREEFRDDPAKQIYREFRDAVEKAEAEAETFDNAVIARASRETVIKCPKCKQPMTVPGDWHAAAWRRERMAPEKYGRRERLILQQETQVQIALDVLELVRTTLEKHLPDVAQRQAILADIIESGVTGGLSTNSPA